MILHMREKVWLADIAAFLTTIPPRQYNHEKAWCDARNPVSPANIGVWALRAGIGEPVEDPSTYSALLHDSRAVERMFISLRALEIDYLFGPRELSVWAASTLGLPATPMNRDGAVRRILAVLASHLNDER